MKITAAHFNEPRKHLFNESRRIDAKTEMRVWPGAALVVRESTVATPSHSQFAGTQLLPDEICMCVASDLVSTHRDLVYVICASSGGGWVDARDMTRGVFHRNSMLY